ncbi:hypothetical protein VCHA53O466_50168 [Vibrio chagasii]|nr:hypothetical protein VCHA53O466_50168 [Vibrio chagasii]
MSKEVKDAIENGRLGAKYPVFSIQGNKVVPQDKIMHFIISNDTFFKNAMELNHAGNTKLLAEMFNYDIGLYDYFTEFSKAVYNTEMELYNRSFIKFSASDQLLNAIGNHAGSSFHLSSINSSSIGDFRTWFNIKTGEISGRSSSYSKHVYSEVIYEDMVALAKNCPYIDVTITMFDNYEYADGDLDATVSIRIANGTLEVVDTLNSGFSQDHEEKVFYGREVFNTRMASEMGVDQVTFGKIASEFKKLVSENKQKAIQAIISEQEGV